jgi:hypothetical protein
MKELALTLAVKNNFSVKKFNSLSAVQNATENMKKELCTIKMT